MYKITANQKDELCLFLNHTGNKAVLGEPNIFFYCGSLLLLMEIKNWQSVNMLKRILTPRWVLREGFFLPQVTYHRPLGRGENTDMAARALLGPIRYR